MGQATLTSGNTIFSVPNVDLKDDIRVGSIFISARVLGQLDVMVARSRAPSEPGTDGRVGARVVRKLAVNPLPLHVLPPALRIEIQFLESRAVGRIFGCTAELVFEDDGAPPVTWRCLLNRVEIGDPGTSWCRTVPFTPAQDSRSTAIPAVVSR